MDGIKEFFGLILAVVVGIGLVIGLCSLAGALPEYMYCKEQAELNTVLEYEWLFWGGGCRVQLPSGIWISAHDIGEYQKNLIIDGLE